jgi:hypothetical protein
MSSMWLGLYDLWYNSPSNGLDLALHGKSRLLYMVDLGYCNGWASSWMFIAQETSCQCWRAFGCLTLVSSCSRSSVLSCSGGMTKW